MKTLVYPLLLLLLSLSHFSWAAVTHVSINQMQFHLGLNPKLKLNIVTDQPSVDKLQFVVAQQSGQERLMVTPVNNFMLQLTGLEDVTDANAELIVQEYHVNQWREVKRITLFDATHAARVPTKPKPSITAKPLVASNTLSSESPKPLKEQQKAPQGDVAADLVQADCELNYEAQQTLWRIGSAYAKSWQLSPYGAMLAIFDANPKAFNQGEIHGLRADVVLRCPSLSVKERYRDAKQAQQLFESM
ncbi:FimV/HubP family polar landmark protein [Shewanella algidipiscicola]|nr:FimV/HubP family polar landmark protein [Shewanella algidipiscicola]